MKFLVTTTVKDMYFTLPKDMKIKLVEGARAFYDNHRASGKCLEAYYVIVKSTISIWEVDSAEELDKILLNYPMFPFIQIEVRTLASLDTHFDELDILMPKLM